MNENKLGEMIKARRLALGLTQSEVANAVLVKNYISISNWERGVSLISRRRIVPLAKVLQMGAVSLLALLPQRKREVNAFASLITSRREALNFSQFEVEKLVGMCSSSLCQIEAGSRLLSPKWFPLLAQVLEVEENDLIEVYLLTKRQMLYNKVKAGVVK